MDDCIFCKIASGEIPSTIVYEDSTVVAFDDLSPQAPVHTLIIPRKHLKDAADDVPADILKAMFDAAGEVARIKGIDESGYRLIINKGADAGQTVFHLHMHLIGGEKLGEGLLASR